MNHKRVKTVDVARRLRSDDNHPDALIRVSSDRAVKLRQLVGVDRRAYVGFDTVDDMEDWTFVSGTSTLEMTQVDLRSRADIALTWRLDFARRRRLLITSARPPARLFSPPVVSDARFESESRLLQRSDRSFRQPHHSRLPG